MPDHFDRLLARHTGPAAAARGATRVRPRLPGPFERVEALRTAPPEPGEPAPLVPLAAGRSAGPAAPVRHEREVRTERETVVRTEAVPPGEPERAPAAPAVQSPLLRPVAHTAPRPRPQAAEGSRAPRRTAARALPDASAPRPAAAGRGAEAAPVAAPAAPVRPRGADGAAVAARGVAPNGIGRRAPRPAERVVHVQIGRLEVTAAPPPGAGSPGAGRPGTGGRPGPALTLDDYLARGETRD
ncbi:hypothetical protein ABZ611_27535 [Streptomyces sp. NPDC007861]|uniref:hypothetical protein n=1 Tax=Streptomyces sp. NPDC007861 TaxID=3154893 RepID=UPI00340433A2